MLIQYLEFKVTLFDVADNQITVLDAQSIDVYPAFPIISLDNLTITIIIASSGIIGAVVGITYLQAKKSSSTKSSMK